ncbi:peroxide stress protein YaaA [Desulfosporosinus sp. PR]|uniref:peroxide stress protein YaaA n=1 Tax=Candidatus Desulfosporosinus nitrosoreducens TaxID=3401928 RepID=UPI0027ED1018|nr:peroxide stress protein YaaA [Desulfosporosinus sp. PR]MDQ7094799.1 peroxide stress protein YaaA [Desulfosporosinus sp. PR]
MKIIISPAKKMNMDGDFLPSRNAPVYLEKAQKLKEYLQSLTYEELKKLLCCNAEIAGLNYERYQKMDLCGSTTPAILAYDGIQYKYMAPQVFEYGYFDYIEDHLRILSGFYGILKPFDGVVPYRLEMQAKLKTVFCHSLYDYWKDDIYRYLTQNDTTILNLASAEYSKTVEKYLTPNVNYVTCKFGELIGGKIIEKGVYVKMARGEMVRFMAENAVEDLNEIKKFRRLDFLYQDELSDNNTFVFMKIKKENC